MSRCERRVEDAPPYDAERAAGPDCLGRSVLVSLGQPPPGPWERCPRVPVTTASADAATGRRLRDAWQARERLVIELDGPLPDTEPALLKSWWEWGPGLTLTDEVWNHLLTANTVDARDPDRLRFAPRDRALEVGARPAARHQAGDVVSPAGSPAWCDGGPLDSFGDGELQGAAQIPAASLAAGDLAVLRHCEPDADLATDQRRAVGHLGGGACIVAPAGSGKTRVLTERARWLVRDLGVTPAAVCLVAYNVRARAEMQERTADLPGLEVRTLNSLALAVCNGTGPFVRPAHHGRVEVIDEREVRDLLHGLVQERAPRRRRRAMTDPLAAWLEALSASRLGLRDPAAVELDYAPDVQGFADLAPAYAETLEERGVVDFDHQIVRAIDVLLTDPAARAAARRVCGVLLVDEFQDLTPAHVLMIRLLGGPRAEVFGVGDDDQTIYGYSGASPRWLIEYERWFPGATRHLLHVNYRCPPAVGGGGLQPALAQPAPHRQGDRRRPRPCRSCRGRPPGRRRRGCRSGRVPSRGGLGCRGRRGGGSCRRRRGCGGAGPEPGRRWRRGQGHRGADQSQQHVAGAADPVVGGRDRLHGPGRPVVPGAHRGGRGPGLVASRHLWLVSAARRRFGHCGPPPASGHLPARHRVDRRAAQRGCAQAAGGPHLRRADLATGAGLRR